MATMDGKLSIRLARTALPAVAFLAGTARALPAGDCPCLSGLFELEGDCGLNPDGSSDPDSDTVNGGCGSSAGAFAPLALGDTYCGTAAWDVGVGGARDTDWFRFDLAQAAEVLWTVSAEFPVEVQLLGDGSGTCPAPLVASAAGPACTPTSVRASLGPGTWFAFVAPDEGGPPLPCGAQYTAALREELVIYTDAAAFDSAHFDVTVEDFSEAHVNASGLCLTNDEPLDAESSGTCFSPGDIEPGLSIRSGTGGGIYVVDEGVTCSGATGLDPADERSIAPREFPDSLEFAFDPPRNAVGLAVESCGPGPVRYTVEVEDPDGAVVLSRRVALSGTLGFWGVSALRPLARLTVRPVEPGDEPTVASVHFADERSCEVLLDEAEFDARYPLLLREDFEEGAVGPGAVVTCPAPLDAETDNACFERGDIARGLSFRSASTSPLLLSGAGVAGYPSKFVGTQQFVDGLLSFDPGVNQLGLRLVAGGTPTEYAVTVYDVVGNALADRSVSVDDDGTFLGFACDRPIGLVLLFAAVGAHNIDDVRFGRAYEVFDDAALFDAAFPDLVLEDLEDANVAPLASCSPATNPVDAAGDGGACFDPGDLEPGLAIGAESAGLTLLGDGFACDGSGNPALSTRIATEDLDDVLVLTFSPPVRQVGFDVQGCLPDPQNAATVQATDAEGRLIAVEALDVVDRERTFYGLSSNRPIATLRLDSYASLFNGASVDEIRFGTSGVHLGRRYCSPNRANSTGHSGVLIATGSNLDADDDLTLTALRLPTTPNVGYFLMGTGANAFVPPGADGFLCVAPGVKRFLPPVNDTSRFPGGFSRVVGTQGQAHPVSAHITAGSVWNFQAWHRDQDAGTSAFTDAVSVAFH